MTTIRRQTQTHITHMLLPLVVENRQKLGQHSFVFTTEFLLQLLNIYNQTNKQAKKQTK